MDRLGANTSGKTRTLERRPATLNPPANGTAEDLLSWLCLALVYIFMLSRFDLRLLFSDTILTGGDSASWYQVLRTLKEEFLPRGRLFGFSQGNFFGYLEGQHYFILPFLAAALLGFAVPLTVALKIVTVAGGFALPLTMFISAASISGRKRSGAIAAAVSLLFLFNESYSIFGGNWLSTFAGEFCYSWAIALLPLLFASLVKDWRKGRKGLMSGAILALIGLCHFFVFMPAFFLPLFPAFPLVPRLRDKKSPNGRGKPGPRREAGIIARILVTYLSALLMMAFWLLPMAATRIWAQPISMIWQFNSFKDFASQTLLWIWAPAGFGFLLAALPTRKNSPRGRRLAAFLSYALGSCAFLFFIAPGLGMPDIRFVPPALLFCGLGVSLFLDAAADRLGRRMRPASGYKAKTLRRKAAGWLPALLAFSCIGAAAAGSAALSRNAAAWYSWNYSGYEAKAEWPFIRFLSERYRGSPGDGRFLWEKQDQRDNRDFGSERAFENLYLFTGHPSSEGIHYGSSMMARAATYLQSSYSPNPVDPEAERIYSKVDPESWPERFDLLNARYIVTHTEAIRGLFSSSPDFVLDASMGKFSIFRYRAYPGSYVSVMPESAIALVAAGAGGFKTDYYRFFRDYELYGTPFVSAEFADRELEARLSQAGGLWPGYDSFRNLGLAKKAVEDQGSQRIGAPLGGEGMKENLAGMQADRSAAVSDEQVGDFEISFSTTAPGKPHYIKISYAPGWRSAGGEKIYPVSPGFMLIYPKSDKVELRYRRTAWEIAGIVLSLLSIPFALIIARKKPGRGFPWKAFLIAGLGLFFAVAVYLSAQSLVGYPALAKDMAKARRINPGDPLRRQELLELVEPWATKENLDRYDNRLVFDAYRLKSLVAAAGGRAEEASELLDTLRARYAHTRVLESLPPAR